MTRRVLLKPADRGAGGGHVLARPAAALLLAAWLLVGTLAHCGQETAETTPPADEPDAQPQSAAPLKIVGLRAGFSGRFKVGFWTPFAVTLEGGAESTTGLVELTVLDGDGVPSRVRGPRDAQVTVDAGRRATVSVYAKVGQLTSDVVVGFRSGPRLVASRTFTPSDPELVGVVPSTRTFLVSLGTPLAQSDEAKFAERGATVVNMTDLARLPSDWWGYEGVDAVVLATDSGTIAAELGRDSPQWAALERWVAMGGKLLVAVGRNAAQVLRAHAPLARLAPGHFEAMATLRDATAFETYAETSEPLAAGAPFALEVPKLVDVHGKIEAYAGGRARDLPLVVRGPYGQGEVIFAAFDVGQAPFAAWRARAQLLDKLLDISWKQSEGQDTGTLGQVTTLGFEDLSGQLRGALDQFAGVDLVPFWLVAVLIVAYIVCIGPLDYFLVKRMLGRMEATWLTFCVTVVAFAAGAYALAYGLKGREMRLNRIDVVDFDAEGNVARGTSWLTLFSPKIAAYDLSLRPLAARVSASTADAPSDVGAGEGVLFSWFGLPGAGFGGMDATTAGVALFNEPYEFTRQLDGLRRVPIGVWSTKSFVGRWWRHEEPAVVAQLRDKGKLLGTLVSQEAAPLEHCVLFYGRWAYPIRQLRPGKTIDVDAELDPQRVDTYLRHVTVQGDRNVSTPYDRASFDIARIVEMMSAHELAGGEKYTGLTHAYQGFTDLSALVKVGRAVLVGHSPLPATSLDLDGRALEDAPGVRWTIHRYIFPVEDEN
jgi:hypothetical protein